MQTNQRDEENEMGLFQAYGSLPTLVSSEKTYLNAVWNDAMTCSRPCSENVTLTSGWVPMDEPSKSSGSVTSRSTPRTVDLTLVGSVCWLRMLDPSALLWDTTVYGLYRVS